MGGFLGSFLGSLTQGGLLKSTGLFLGAFGAFGHFIFHNGEESLLTYNRAGGGKGTTLIQPNLAHSHDRTLVVVDIKDGELAFSSSAHRRDVLDTDVIYFGSQCVLFPDRARLFLDTKWDSDFKATSLMSVRLGGSTPTANVFPHASADFIPIPASDYSFSFERGGPNPTAIHWHNDAQRRWYESPVMISGRRPWADFTTALTTASWATDVPGIDKDLWDAYIRAELFSMHDVLRADPENATRLGRANYDLQAVASQFKKTGPARSRSFRPFASAP